jgi:hypothetical protein
MRCHRFGVAGVYIDQNADQIFKKPLKNHKNQKKPLVFTSSDKYIVAPKPAKAEGMNYPLLKLQKTNPTHVLDQLQLSIIAKISSNQYIGLIQS